MALWKTTKWFLVLLFFILKVLAEENFNLNFFQNDYHFKLERADVSSYNRNYMKTASLISFKYNRTIVALNLTFECNIDVGSELQAVVQAYKFASNEYRLFSLRMGSKSCKLFEADAAGLKRSTRCRDFSQCLFLKNKIYRICNFALDESKLPSYLPTGRYMVETQLSFESVDMFATNTYFEVTRSEVKKYI